MKCRAPPACIAIAAVLWLPQHACLSLAIAPPRAAPQAMAPKATGKRMSARKAAAAIDNLESAHSEKVKKAQIAYIMQVLNDDDRMLRRVLGVLQEDLKEQ
eukprot:805757-Alexandrium_andersonii.AAC.1